MPLIRSDKPMALVRLNQQLERVEIAELKLDNPIAFAFFDGLPADERDAALIRAINIGVLAMKEDRLAAFLSKTTNELGTELQNLKMIFEMKQEVFFKTAIKGALAEDDVAEFLQEFCREKKFDDVIELTGNSAGKLHRNKTGDILSKLDGRDDLRIAIECKFDKSIRVGDIGTKDVFGRKADTVWSQLIEAQANRDGKIAIIVLDRSLIDANVLKTFDNVSFIPGVGFVAIIDTQRGNFANLGIAYLLARDVAVNTKVGELDHNLLVILIRRILKDIADISQVRELVASNAENLRKILEKISKNFVSMEFTRDVLLRFLEVGTLTSEELLLFYTGEGVSEKYKTLEPDITHLLEGSNGK